MPSRRIVIPASDAQKKKLADLIHRGFRKGLKHKTFVNLTSGMAKSMIWHAVQAEKAGQTIEGFVPRTKSAPVIQEIDDDDIPF